MTMSATQPRGHSANSQQEILCIKSQQDLERLKLRALHRTRMGRQPTTFPLEASTGQDNAVSREAFLQYANRQIQTGHHVTVIARHDFASLLARAARPAPRQPG